MHVDLKEEENRFIVSHCQMASGKEVYNDTDRRYLSLFAFAHPSDTLFLREPASKEISEVRFLSKGITLKRLANGKWQGTDQFSQYYLVQDSARLKQLLKSFGDDFHQFVLPLESVDAATDVKKSLFLTFPTRLAANKLDTSLNGDADTPILPVMIESGKVGLDDGRMRSTTAESQASASTPRRRGCSSRARSSMPLRTGWRSIRCRSSSTR
jgi:hypothetical protein